MKSVREILNDDYLILTFPGLVDKRIHTLRAAYEYAKNIDIEAIIHPMSPNMLSYVYNNAEDRNKTFENVLADTIRRLSDLYPWDKVRGGIRARKYARRERMWKRLRHDPRHFVIPF